VSNIIHDFFIVIIRRPTHIYSVTNLGLLFLFFCLFVEIITVSKCSNLLLDALLFLDHKNPALETLAMTSSPSSNMLLLPPSAFHSTLSLYSTSEQDHQKKTVHEQLEQLQVEIGRLRTNNEAQKTSGRGKKETASTSVASCSSVSLKIYLSERHP
jgi:hypothetical protein